MREKQPTTASEAARMSLIDAFLTHSDSPVMREACIQGLKRIVRDPSIKLIEIERSESPKK